MNYSWLIQIIHKSLYNRVILPIKHFKQVNTSYLIANVLRDNVLNVYKMIINFILNRFFFTCKWDRYYHFKSEYLQVMAVKEYAIFPKVLGQKLDHQMQFTVNTQDIRSVWRES